MKSHEVLRKSFKKVGAKRVAHELGLSSTLVHKWSRPGQDGGSEELNPLDRIALMCVLTGDRAPVQWLCEQLDGFFVANPKTKRIGDVESLLAWCRAMRRLTDLQSALTEPLSGASMSRAAVERLRELWETLKSEMEWYVKLSERCGLAALLPQRARVFALV